MLKARAKPDLSYFPQMDRARCSVLLLIDMLFGAWQLSQSEIKGKQETGDYGRLII